MKAKHLALLLLVGLWQTTAGQTKPIPLSVKVEAEGDELVTHEVFAGADLTSLTHTIAFQFASVRLRSATGLWK